MQRIFAILLIFVFNNSVPAQTSAEIKNKLNKAGITEVSCKFLLEDADYEKILYFDFTQYREYDKKRQVQVVNGPLIELSSLKDMQAKGVSIDVKLLDDKKQSAEHDTKHKTIPQVDVGIRKQKAVYVPELEKSIKKAN